jgi:hypothetical protein
MLMPIRIQRTFQIATAICLTVYSAGCAKNKNLVVDNRPIIEGASSVSGSGSTVVVNKPVGSKFIDRHPIFYKPGEYYSTSDGNMVVRGARATFIGVPAGFVGEFKQAFKGVPKTIRIQ